MMDLSDLEDYCPSYIDGSSRTKLKFNYDIPLIILRDDD